MNRDVVVGSMLLLPVHLVVLAKCPLVVVKPWDLLFSRCLAPAAGRLLHPARSALIPPRKVLYPDLTLVTHLLTRTRVITKRVPSLQVRPNPWKQVLL